jgi:hypothetical protein
VSDEWVTQMLRQGDAQVMEKYSQMKLQMKRKASRVTFDPAIRGHMKSGHSVRRRTDHLGGVFSLILETSRPGRVLSHSIK